MEQVLFEPVELTDAELDVVAGGSAAAAAAGSLGAAAGAANVNGVTAANSVAVGINFAQAVLGFDVAVAAGH
jgi:hypothetical protein